MNTLKQIIKEVQQYQCTEGNIADCELRTLALRVNLLREISDICYSHLKQFEKAETLFQYGDDVFLLANLIAPFTNDIQKKISEGLDQNTVFECLRTAQITFKRVELLTKYEGKDKEFVERIIMETDEYFDVKYGKE